MKRIFLKLWRIGITILLLVMLVIVIFQQKRMADLYSKTKILEETKIGYSDCYAGYQEDAYNYLAIGNSITIHIKCDYWWNNCGMGASREENDYYHIVTKNLENRYGKVCSAVCNLATWEMLSTDRAEATDLLIPYLSDELDLVTIQLGENVSDMGTFYSDYSYLISYIQERAPKAQIIVIGDFWKKGDRDKVKYQVAKENHLFFVNLEDIQNDKNYKINIGDVVYDDKGVEHTVNHKGVAKHPNDLGMKYIAEEILNLVE